MGLLKHLQKVTQVSRSAEIHRAILEQSQASPHGRSMFNSFRNLEQLLVETAISRWEQHWLYQYGKNPIILAETTLDAKTLMEREEYTGMSEEAAAADYAEIQAAEALVDIDSISRMTWDDISSELQRIRNFTEYEHLSDNELDLLDYKCFMIYKIDVSKFSVLFCDKQMTDSFTEVPTTLCFVKKESSLTMHFSNAESTFNKEFNAKIWIYRIKNIVSFYLGEASVVYSINFDSVKEAESFESSFMFTAEFADKTTVIRLYGEFAAQQLIYKGFTGTNKNRHPHVDYLTELMKNASAEDHTPYHLNSTNDKQLETIRRRMTEYVKYTYDLHVFLFKSCISTAIVMENILMTVELLLDQKTLERILAFSTRTSYENTNPPNGVSFSKLNLHLSFIFHNLVCCNMMRFVFNTYSLNRDHLLSTVMNVQQCIITQWLNGNKEAGNQQEMARNNFHVMEVVQEYFALYQGSSDFPAFFTQLDRILRVGDISIFEVIEKTFRAQITEDLFYSKTYFGFDKEFFEDRSSTIVTNILSRSNTDNVVSIEEISNWSLSAVDSHNFQALSVAEDFVCQIVQGCIRIHRALSTSYEEIILCFNMAEWLKYVEIFTEISSLGSSTTNLPLQQASTSQEYSLPGCLRNSASCEPAWQRYQNYEASEFEEIKSLRGGGYGFASILERLTSRNKVVLKKYNANTTAEERKREIDMLIRLQKNENIVNFIGFFFEFKEDFGSTPAGILLEYVERNLSSFIHDKTKVNGSEKFQYPYRYRTAIDQMRGVASAFDSMHKQHIIHKDLKPDNVLLTNGDKIKICDLGMCGFIDNIANSITTVGTPHYTAPETLAFPLNYNEKIDVFSFGVTMWEQIHRRKPYWNKKTNNAVFKFVLDGKRMNFDDDCLPELKNIIQEAWSQDPTDRPSMEQLEFRLSELLKSLFPEDLQKEVLGPYEKVIDAGSVFYVHKDEKP